ncbi:MAG TPA: hypothetical protein VF660_08265 [Actinomycetota bacterium]
MKRVMLLLFCVLVACAAPQGDRVSPGAPLAPDSPIAASPSPGGSPHAGRPTFVAPRSGLVEPRPHSFERARPTGRRTLVVRFYGGIEACEGLDHIAVKYRPREIVVTVFTGRVPSAQVCIEVAVLKVTKVRLDEPIRGRRIVDGAPGT